MFRSWVAGVENSSPACFIRLLSLWRATSREVASAKQKDGSENFAQLFERYGAYGSRMRRQLFGFSETERRFTVSLASTFRSSCSNSRMRRSLASHVSGGTVHSASAKQKDGLWRATFRSSCSNDHHNRWLRRNRKTVLGWFTVSACLWLERNSCLLSSVAPDGSRMRQL